jgi:hypothetical protein
MIQAFRERKLNQEFFEMCHHEEDAINKQANNLLTRAVPVWLLSFCGNPREPANHEHAETLGAWTARRSLAKLYYK